MRILAVSTFFGLVLALPPSLGGARAESQTSTGQPSRTPSMPTMPPVDGRDTTANPPDPFAAMRQAQMARAVSKDRQKRIVEDTAKLLTLATELKQDVDKTTKDEMSLDVIRKADEIERLAHDVKQRMKG